MSPNKTIGWLASVRRHFGIVVMVAALAAGIGLLVTANGTPDADAKPINPYVPCPQWQEMHPGWPCWGNFPEIEEPTAPTPLQPSLPSAPPSAPPAQPPAGALTPPSARPAPDPCTAIIAVPGYRPPALPGQPANAPCSSGEEPRRVPSPRELLEPYIRPACGLAPLGSDVVHEIVTEIVGPLEAELGSEDPLVARVTERANFHNKECLGNKNQIKEKVWEEVRNDWYKKYRDRNMKRDRKKKWCSVTDTSKDCEGLVAVCLPSPRSKRLPATLSPVQLRNLKEQRDKYIDAANDLTYANPGSPLTRKKLTEADEILVDRARERKRNSDRATYYPPKVDTDVYPSGTIHAGHLPDTTWSGNPDPLPKFWLPMDGSLNSSIGSQAEKYPENYKARAFVPGEWIAGVGCVPQVDPRVLRAVPPTIAPY
ncbi:hypothetical protein [Nocardia altamirensis]|uniref:hypothetical protein n=1 Tax=Nocardia altamirensis TaxID=472158 RepID=UPI0008406F91|nr:hypothetical protein [Nocardia altamirensis]